MHLSALAIIFLIAPLLASTITTTISPASTCPFSTPLATLASQEDHLALRIRQAVTTITSSGSCPNGYFGCSNLGAPQACCSSTAICTTDVVNHVACCASGASCTGVIGAGTASSGTGSGGTVTTTTNSNGQGTIVATNGIIVTAGSATNGASPARDGAVGVRWVGWIAMVLWAL